MSVLDEDVVGAIGVETTSGKVILTVADHLDWADEKGHLLALQKKLNGYLAFVESGELNEVYPDSRGREPVIETASWGSSRKAARRSSRMRIPIRSEGRNVSLSLGYPAGTKKSGHAS